MLHNLIILILLSLSGKLGISTLMKFTFVIIDILLHECIIGLACNYLAGHCDEIMIKVLTVTMTGADKSKH